MALTSADTDLIAAAREDIAGFDADATRVRADDAGARPGSLYGPRTPKQLAEQRASIEAEKAEYERDGNAGGVQACDAELQRLEAEPVAEPSPTRTAVAGGYLTAGSPPPPPRQRTDKQVEEYVASLERERDVYVKEGKLGKAQECDVEIARATATHSAHNPRNQR
ncbi:MAG TPA: hypothetical protein VL979_11295 [Solirubrobacteraceae bacterium]|nr:hypothetical protein [Solirubrobacteraceae bacterium]